MKNTISLIFLFATCIIAQSQHDNAQFSLFNEDYKNNLHESAYEYGWYVINHNPDPFVKFRLFPKMEKTLFYMHDSLAANEEQQSMYADTTLAFYEKAIEHQPEKKPYWLAKKAFVTETWTDSPIEVVIIVYEDALNENPDLDTYYQDRYGLLLTEEADKDPDLKLKALELYSKLSEQEPDNPIWISRIENLADNPEELLDITYKAWQIKKESIEKAWKYASLAMRNQQYEKAIEPLEFMVSRNSDVINYWVQLSTAYQKLENYNKALDAYKKLIELEQDNAEHYVNAALMYKNMNDLPTSRKFLLDAEKKNPDWDYPLYIEAIIYEQAARNCGFEFMDKVVYQLAVNKYRAAASKSGTYSSASRERVAALSNSVPSQEDYFFRKIKSGETIKIEGGCYDWINRSITVP